MPTDADIALLADNIADDITARRAFDPHAQRIGADLDLAYRVQRAVVLRLEAQRADRTIGGYKIAFNKPSSMDYYRIGEPCLAPVFADRIVATGARLAGADYNELVIEPELIVTLATDVAPGADRAAVMAALGPVRPGFELMDVRGAFARDPTAAQAVAQGIYNAGAVLGGPGIAIGDLDLSRIETRVAIEGGVVEKAIGAVPQDPVEAVAWVARTLEARGERLKAGMIVLCGTHLPTRTVTAPADIRVDMSGLGSAEFRLR
jgi:2-keto-4-pentenoate hydratase